MIAKILAYVRANWKTNLAAACAFAYSVPQFVTAITAWQAHQTADWRAAIISLIIALGLAAAKDGDNHSTVAQVQASTAKANGQLTSNGPNPGQSGAPSK